MVRGLIKHMGTNTDKQRPRQTRHLNSSFVLLSLSLNWTRPWSPSSRSLNLSWFDVRCIPARGLRELSLMLHILFMVRVTEYAGQQDVEREPFQLPSCVSFRCLCEPWPCLRRIHRGVCFFFLSTICPSEDVRDWWRNKMKPRVGPLSFFRLLRHIVRRELWKAEKAGVAIPERGFLFLPEKTLDADASECSFGLLLQSLRLYRVHHGHSLLSATRLTNSSSRMEYTMPLF